MFRFKIPSDIDSLLHIKSDSTHSHENAHFSLLVWNIYKGKFGQRWVNDIDRLVRTSDIVLLQEAMTSEQMLDVFKINLDGYHWHFAASFQYRNLHSTGVMTGSKIPSISQKFVRSQERELGFLTPKVTLFTELQLLQKQLLVVNTHAINFTTNKAFVRFISHLAAQIEVHQGPIVFAGDFNTWNPARWRELTFILKQLELKEVVFNEDPRFLRLDHVFFRGLEVKSAQILSDIQSSDHFPIRVEFILPD